MKNNKYRHVTTFTQTIIMT